MLKAENKNSALYYAFSVLSGVLLALPWHGFPGWILLIALIPLLISEKFFSSHNNNIGIFLSGFIAFFTWNLFSTGWMTWVNFAGGTLIILINTFFLSLVFTFFSVMRRKLGKATGYFLLILFWLSYEYYLIHGKPGWPWLVLGNGLGSSISLIQWYSYTGVLGGSLWILLINVLLFRFLSGPVRFVSLSQFISTAVVFFLILLLPPVLSLRLKAKDIPVTRKIDILIVQTNLDPITQKFSTNLSVQFNNLMKKTKSSIQSNPDLIVWPETVVDSFWIDRESDHRAGEIETLVRENSTALLFGAMTFKEVTDEANYKWSLRESDSGYFVVSNSAILWQQDNIQEYKKNILVPGVETIPVFFHEAFRIGYFASLGGVGGSLYTDYKKTPLILNDSAALIPVICFESAVGEHVASFRPGIPFLVVNITNDGWFQFRHAYFQHLLMARIRAVENSADVIRVANTGISTRIDSKGNVHEMLPVRSEGTLLVSAKLAENTTWYSENGDFVGRIAVFFTILALLLFLTQFLKLKKTKKTHL